MQLEWKNIMPTFEKKRKIIISGSAFLITAIVFIICYRHSYMLYMTNDDAGIQNLLNGFTTGVYDPAHQFISIFLGYPLAYLYKAIPNVQWWFVYSQILMLIGIFLINYSFITLGTEYSCFEDDSQEKKVCRYSQVLKMLVLWVMVVLFNIGFSIPAISSTSFTVVPAIYGAGIVSLLFLRGYRHRVDNRTLVLILIFFLPVLFHRKSTAYAVFCYLLLACLWVLVQDNMLKIALKKLLLWFGIAVLVLGLFTIADSKYKNWINGAEFAEFNKARAELLDHSRDAYEENPKLYETVGWDRDTYVMVCRWCFVDERCTAENFHYIAENSNAKDSSTKVVIAGMFSDSRMNNLLCIFSLVCGATSIMAALMRDVCRLLFLALDFMGSFVLVTYQILMGRVLYRSLVVVLLPAFVVMALLMVSVNQKTERIFDENNLNQKGDSNRLKKTVGGICFGIVFLASLMALNHSILLAENFVCIQEIRTNAYTDKDDLIHQYLMNQKGNFYVLQTGIKANINPRLLYKDDISNSFYWGGSDYHSHTRKYVLQKNGLEQLDDEAFLKDNVYLISAETYSDDVSSSNKEELEKTRSVYAFCHWMSTLHPEYVMVKVDEIYNGMNVYHFVLRE